MWTVGNRETSGSPGRHLIPSLTSVSSPNLHTYSNLQIEVPSVVFILSQVSAGNSWVLYPERRKRTGLGVNFD